MSCKDNIQPRVACTACPSVDDVKSVPHGQFTQQIRELLNNNFEVIRCLVDNCGTGGGPGPGGGGGPFTVVAGPNPGDYTVTDTTSGESFIIPIDAANQLQDLDGDTRVDLVESGAATGGDQLQFVVDGTVVGNVEILAGGLTKWTLDGILDPVLFVGSPFNCTGAVANTTAGQGSLYVSDGSDGFTAGTWVKVENGVCSSFADPEEEVVENAGPLAGAAPADAKLGVDTLSGQLYYVSGGNWVAVPVSVVDLNTTVGVTQPTPYVSPTPPVGAPAVADDGDLFIQGYDGSIEFWIAAAGTFSGASNASIPLASGQDYATADLTADADHTHTWGAFNQTENFTTGDFLQDFQNGTNTASLLVNSNRLRYQTDDTSFNGSSQIFATDTGLIEIETSRDQAVNQSSSLTLNVQTQTAQTKLNFNANDGNDAFIAIDGSGGTPHVYVQEATQAAGTATNSQVLTLVNDATGEVQYETVAAENVSIVDAGTYFVGTDVEAALQELGAVVAAGSDGVVTGGTLTAGTLTLTRSVGVDIDIAVAAAEVPIVDAGAFFVATNVEDALQELAQKTETILTADLTADANHTQDFATFDQTWNDLGTWTIDQEISTSPGSYAGTTWDTGSFTMNNNGGLCIFNVTSAPGVSGTYTLGAGGFSLVEDAGGNDASITGSGGTITHAVNSAVAGEGSYTFVMDGDGFNLTFDSTPGKETDFRLDGDAGVAGQVFTTNGPDAAPTWEDLPASEVEVAEILAPTAQNTIPDLSQATSDVDTVKIVVNGNTIDNLAGSGIEVTAAGVVTVTPATLGYNIEIGDRIIAYYRV